MNTGQRLVELSGLPSGSALAHFAAITQTGGTGPGEHVASFRCAVVTGQRRHFVSTLQPKPTGATDVRQALREVDSREENDAYVKTAGAAVSVRSVQESVFVTSTYEQSLSVFEGDKGVIYVM